MEPLPPIVIFLLAIILVISFVIKDTIRDDRKKDKAIAIFDILLRTYIFITFLNASISFTNKLDLELKERTQSVFDQNKTEGEIFSDQMKDYIKKLQSELTALRSFEYKEVELMKGIEFVEVRDTFYVNGDTVITIKQEIKKCN